MFQRRRARVSRGSDHERTRGQTLVSLGYAVRTGSVRSTESRCDHGAGRRSDPIRSDPIRSDPIRSDPIELPLADRVPLMSQSATASRADCDVRAVASLRGMLATRAPVPAIRPRVLACTGAATDSFCPPEQRAAFETEMTAVGADWQHLIFGGVRSSRSGAMHGFSVPDIARDGCAYHADADRRSWKAMLALFSQA